MTDGTLQRKPSKPSRHISLAYCVAQTRIFPYTYGVVFSHRPSIHSTCCEAHESHQTYQHMHTFGSNMTSMRPHSHHLDARLKPISNQQYVKRGPPTQPVGTTLGRRGITTDVTRYTSPTPSIPASAKQFSSSTNTSQCPVSHQRVL